jgi:hypothetical protein
VLEKVAGNEVPDDFEKTRRERNNRSRRRPFQFIVYDIAAESEKGFPYLDDPTNRQVQDEHRWLYFNVGNFDGTPDNTAAETDPQNKYYRTNFWEAKADPVDPNTFYLSHRGPPKDGGSPHANHIVRVRMTGNPRKKITLGGVERPDFTSNYLEFERVYGFAGSENNQFHYPGDFEVVDLAGQKLLVVNHFRDLVNWVRGDTYFSVVAKVMDEFYWQGETSNNQDPFNSYYQVATAPDGRTLTGSFYGNAVILLDVTPGADIREIKRIE